MNYYVWIKEGEFALLFEDRSLSAEEEATLSQEGFLCKHTFEAIKLESAQIKLAKLVGIEALERKLEDLFS